jgi:hypothetical protein
MPRRELPPPGLAENTTESVIADVNGCASEAPPHLQPFDIDVFATAAWTGLHYRHEFLLHHRHELLEHPHQ